ncbi:zf-HC2 domain-containing protein [Fodinicola feengrottensis]|nr:zf-HC2 domain-containing protein [Fodinicola feengrottensis]
MIREPGIGQVVLLAALVGLLSQSVFEFGPLWLVALAAPAVLFGPYWAALVSTLGVGGLLTSKLNLGHPLSVGVLAVAAPAAAIALTLTRSLVAVIATQAVLALLLAIISIRAGKLLHDGVPSAVRAGVSSGVGTLSWLLFLPFSLVFGWYARTHGVPSAGWFLTGAAVLIGLLLITSVRRPSVAEQPADCACEQFVELVTDFLDSVLPPDLKESFQTHLADCVGCQDYLGQIRDTIRALKQADLHLAP